MNVFQKLRLKAALRNCDYVLAGTVIRQQYYDAGKNTEINRLIDQFMDDPGFENALKLIEHNEMMEIYFTESCEGGLYVRKTAAKETDADSMKTAQPDSAGPDRSVPPNGEERTSSNDAERTSAEVPSAETAEKSRYIKQIRESEAWMDEVIAQAAQKPKTVYPPRALADGEKPRWIKKPAGQDVDFDASWETETQAPGKTRTPDAEQESMIAGRRTWAEEESAAADLEQTMDEPAASSLKRTTQGPAAAGARRALEESVTTDMEETGQESAATSLEKAEEQPATASLENTVEESASASVGKIMEEPVSAGLEKAAQEPAATSVTKTEEQPAAISIERTMRESAATSVEKTTEEPAPAGSEKTVRESATTSVGKTKEQPAAINIEGTMRESASTSVGKSVSTSAEKTMEERATTSTKKTMQTPALASAGKAAPESAADLRAQTGYASAAGAGTSAKTGSPPENGEPVLKRRRTYPNVVSTLNMDIHTMMKQLEDYRRRLQAEPGEADTLKGWIRSLEKAIDEFTRAVDLLEGDDG